LERSSKPSTESYRGSRELTAARCGKMIFSAYRRDQYEDPDAFSEQLFLVLKSWDENVIVAVSDPRSSRSLQQQYKFPPTIAEVVAACEEESERQRKAAAAGPPKRRIFSPQIDTQSPGQRANVLVRADAPQYAEAIEWAKTADEADWRADQR